MFGDDALEQRGRHSAIPDALRIHNHDRPAGADAEAGRLTALDAAGAKQETLALQQFGEHRIELAPTAIRGAIAAGAHDDVAAIRFHRRLHCGRIAWWGTRVIEA